MPRSSMLPLALAATIATTGAACKSTSATGATKQTMAQQLVTLTTAHGPERIMVELARTEDERAYGLMFRKELARDRGMLFLFERNHVQKFWMKNTLIPLDMIFIGEDLKVVGVEANAEPLTLDARGPDLPSKYVLEVVGGWAEQNGLRPGAAVEFSGFTY